MRLQIIPTAINTNVYLLGNSKTTLLEHILPCAHYSHKSSTLPILYILNHSLTNDDAARPA